MTKAKLRFAATGTPLYSPWEGEGYRTSVSVRKIALGLVLGLIFFADVNAEDVKIKLNSNDGSTSFQVRDNADNVKAQIDSQGNLLLVGSATVLGNGGMAVQGPLIIEGSSGSGEKLKVNGSMVVQTSMSIETPELGADENVFQVLNPTFSILYDGTVLSARGTLDATNAAGNSFHELRFVDNVDGQGWAMGISRCAGCLVAGSDNGDLVIKAENGRNFLMSSENGTSTSFFVSSAAVGFLTGSPQGLFQVGPGSLTVSQNGKVGVGLTNPGARLQVFSPAGSREMQIAVTTGSTHIFEVAATSAQSRVPLTLNGTLTIDANLPIGIRLRDPVQNKYFALGIDASNSYGRIDPVSGGLTYMAFVTSPTLNPNNNPWTGIHFYDTKATTKRMAVYSDKSDDNWYWAATRNSFTLYDAKLNIHGFLAVSGIVISSGNSEPNLFAGDVGIGIASPTCALEVFGGSITTRGATAGLRISGPAGEVNTGLIFASTGSTNYFRVASQGTTFIYGRGAFQTGGADFAEVYSASESLEPGDVVIANADGKICRSQTPEKAPRLLGVVSTYPGFVAGGDMDRDITELKGAYAVALQGRTPVKASLENGPIQPGDQLTASSRPGYAMRATGSGRVLGIALEPFDENDPDGKVLLFMSLGHWVNPQEYETLAANFQRMETQYAQMQQDLELLKAKVQSLKLNSSPKVGKK